ncbi:MAG: M20 family metallopeptidase [Candidatus Kapaibacterium sp.]
MDIHDIKIETEKIFDEIVSHRRHFHQYPELSGEEFATSDYIRDYLKEIGIETLGIAGTGRIGMIGDGEHCIALRADMDALPLDEETGLEYSSKKHGSMHACGHDMHMAMLLGAARILKKNEKELRGCIKLLFQPSEEKLPGGAAKMIEQGALEDPIPFAIFGQHVEPSMPAGKIAITEGPIFASSDEIYIELIGKGSHAGQPHLGNDPLIVASQLALHFNNLLNKHKNPLHPALLAITSIQGGSAPNIYPDRVRMMGTLRTYDDHIRFGIHEKIKKDIGLICSLYGVEPRINITAGYPPLINHDSTSEFVRETAVKLFGESDVLNMEPKMWAEDFAYFARQAPSAFWMVGARPSDESHVASLHNPRFAPDEEAMKYGTVMLAATAFEFLSEKI